MLFRLIHLMLTVMGAVGRRIGLKIATRLHRATLAKVGAGSRFQAGVNIGHPSQVQIGRDCYVWTGVGVSAEDATGAMHIGDRVQINRDVHLDMTGGLILDDDVLISEGAVLYTHDHGLDPHATPDFMPKKIGQGVWIGMRAVVLPGCQHIGAGAVIGAGAIVTCDVPAGAIMAGNPARAIGHRQLAEVAA